MSTTLSGPEPADQPDPDRPATGAPSPFHLARLLRRVFDYGKHLIVAVRLRAACPEFPRLAKPFGTAELRLILARISSAMARVLVLEDRFIRQAGLGRYAVPPRTRSPSPRKPRAATRPDAAPGQDQGQPPAPARPVRRPGNPLIPTVAQIAVELRRHPAGVMLAGICRDLGITPHHPLWDEVSLAITTLGGSVAELEQDADTRWCSRRWLQIPVARPDSVPAYLWPKWWPQPEPPADVATATTETATGPPDAG